MEAEGGAWAAGIGASNGGNGYNITISGDAQVKASGGERSDGGSATAISGTPNTANLTDGSIAYYNSIANKETSAPEKLLHKDGSDTHTHTGVTLKSSTAATCTENATVTYLCGCNAEITTELLGTALGHKLGDYASNNDATCMKDGTKTAYCIHAGCGYFVTVADEGTRDPSKHSFTNYISNGDATCTSDGTKTAKCAYGCGAEDTQPDAGSKLAHKFDNYVPNNDATYEADGTQTAKCDRGCGASDTVSEPGTRIPLYRVVDAEGREIPSQERLEGGTLTITADRDEATLTGGLNALSILRQRGVTAITFVTNGAASTFDLSVLTGSGTYALTHTGATATLTLNGWDTSSILK